MFKRLKAKIYSRKIKRLIVIRPKKYIVFLSDALKYVVVFGILLGLYFLSNKYEILVAQKLPNDQSWAIALIAIPFALLAVYFSIHVMIIKKMNQELVLCFNIRAIYKKHAYYIFDDTMPGLLTLFISFIIWLNYLLGNQDIKFAYLMLVSFYMMGLIIWLIFFDMHILKIQPDVLFAQAFIREVRMGDFYAKEADINELLDNYDSDYWYQCFEKIYRGEMVDCMQGLYCALVSNSANGIQKNSIIQLINRITKMRADITKFLLMAYSISISSEILVQAFNNNDYEFFKSIGDAIDNIFVNCMNTVLKISNKTDEFKQANNFIDNLTNKETKQLIDDINKSQGNYLRYLRVYIEMHLKIGKALKEIINKSSDKPRFIKDYVNNNFVWLLDHENRLSEINDMINNQRNNTQEA